ESNDNGLWGRQVCFEDSRARRARPWATEVNSLPVRTRAGVKRDSKMRRTAGTKLVPPVRKTRSIWSGLTADEARRDCTQVSMLASSSAIQDSKSARETVRSIS